MKMVVGEEKPDDIPGINNSNCSVRPSAINPSNEGGATLVNIPAMAADSNMNGTSSGAAIAAITCGDLLAANDETDGRPSLPTAEQDGGESGRRPRRHSCARGRRLRRQQRRGFMVTGIRNMHSRHGQWTCFFCCHVVTGSAIIGAWHVLLHVLALCLLSMAVVYPGLLGATSGDGGRRSSYLHKEYNAIGHMQDIQAVNCSIMPCSLATQHGGGGSSPRAAPDFPLALGHLLSTHQLNSEAVSVAVFITLCTLLVTLLMLYGVHCSQPSHLMPFFFLQVFDFCISSMTMVSYLSYLPNLRQLLQETPAFPFRDQLLSMQTNCLTFFVLAIFLATFMVKAYCINIVWRCYKYLLVCRAAAAGGQATATTGAEGTRPPPAGGTRLTVSNPGPEHCMHWLLPQDYRTKVAGAYPEPPPSYDMAMAAFGTTEEAAPQYTEQMAAAAAQDASQGTAAVAAPGTDDAPLLPHYEEAVTQGTSLPQRV